VRARVAPNLVRGARPALATVRWAVVPLAVVLLAPACRRPAGSPPPFTQPVTLGGRTVAPAALEHGRGVYTQYCRPCHGDAGDGKGTSAAGLQTPPRDLRLGVYKFAAVAAGQLPRDEDLLRTIRKGLRGTAMLAWDVPVPELDDLIQYVKSLAPRWRTETAGDAIVVPPDPWRGRASDAIERGKRVYHGLAQCAVACHPAYATKAEIYAFTKELTGMALTDFRPDLYLAVAKDSDYGVKILPPDFTFNELRAGDTPDDIYRTIASGIGGTAMPTWKNVLPDPDLWAMAYYVRSLVELRDRPEADALAQRLRDQPPWSPPPQADAGADRADDRER
jgi:mono/diheme cytochrome c family protein